LVLSVRQTLVKLHSLIHLHDNVDELKNVVLPVFVLPI